MSNEQENNKSENCNELKLYTDCIAKQLEEVDLLMSIYCTNGEMQILDASVISDFNEFLKDVVDPNLAAIKYLKAHLEYTIQVSVLHLNKQEKLDVRIELPHLYPQIEDAIVIIHTPLLSKAKEQYFKHEIEQYITSMDKQETYIFQVLSWIQEQFEILIKRDASEFVTKVSEPEPVVALIKLERLWIYSHHIKSKIKRHDILKEARNLNLSGFSRPGKPGIICVEGEQMHVQEFWQVIRTMHWQKIAICKSETARKPRTEIDKWRRFVGFKEQLFSDEPENEMCIMNMSLFIKFLEAHNSGYMKKELFGLV